MWNTGLPPSRDDWRTHPQREGGPVVHRGPVLWMLSWKPTFWNCQPFRNIQKNYKGRFCNMQHVLLFCKPSYCLLLNCDNNWVIVQIQRVNSILMFCRWICSSPEPSQTVHGTWSPSCFATAPLIASHYRVSSTTHGCVPTLTDSCHPPTLSRNPEPADLPCSEGCFICHTGLWARMFWVHCHGLQTAIILAHFMLGIPTFILYSVTSLSMSSILLFLSRGVCAILLSLLFWIFYIQWTQLCFGFLYLSVLTPKYYC